MTSDHFENLRQDEAQSAHERDVNQAFAERQADDAADEAPYEEGKEPGHLGNDTSGMTLLDTDLEALAREEREPNPEVRQALDELREIPVRDRIEEADN